MTLAIWWLRLTNAWFCLRLALIRWAEARLQRMRASMLERSFPWCDACESWHHPRNPTCRRLAR